MDEKKYFDVIVIGSGPGGYIAAIKSAQMGKKVAIVEKGSVGGVCLNVGCIPTKTLLANAQIMEKITSAADYGISVGDVKFDFAKMKARKDAVVEKLRKGVEMLLQTNGIALFRGHAEYLSPREIKVKGHDNCILYADNTIVATGSLPMEIAAFPCDGKKVFNSTSILELTALPKTLAIIGGGYIGCEFASLYAEFGVKVVILEALPSIIMTQGKALSEALSRAFIQKGIDIQTNVFVEGIDHVDGGLSIRLKGKDPLSCDMALVAVGRKVVSKDLGLEKAGVKLGDKGEVVVNSTMETNVPGIYAIGDVTGKYLLAHVASHQGVIAGANASGQHAEMHYEAVPAVIFTSPEIATVGLTLEQAQEKGYAAVIGKFPFQALGKAIATMDTEGFAQIVIDKKTGLILGAQVVGHEAATLIAEVTLAINNELTVECLVDTIHAHPTMAESWLEAALIATDSPLNFPPKKKSNVQT